MNTASQTAFHPYKVISQGRNTLQLQPAAGQKAAVIIFRIMPVILLATGVVFYLTQKDLFFLLIFGGIALLEALIFSFIKIPASLSMDSVGFTLETLSIKGKEKRTIYGTMWTTSAIAWSVLKTALP